MTLQEWTLPLTEDLARVHISSKFENTGTDFFIRFQGRIEQRLTEKNGQIAFLSNFKILSKTMTNNRFYDSTVF